MSGMDGSQHSKDALAAAEREMRARKTCQQLLGLSEATVQALNPHMGSVAPDEKIEDAIRRAGERAIAYHRKALADLEMFESEVTP